MKSLEEKMKIHWDLALPIITELSDNHRDQDKAIFEYGWKACAKEYEQENAELKRQLEIAKETLNKIKSPHFGLCMSSSDEEAREYWFDLASDYREQAEEALKDLESAGE